MQYSLVGDLVMSVREGNADVPQSLSAPTNVQASVSGSGSTSYFFKVTQLTPWGESAPSTEVTLTSQSLTGTVTVTGNCSFTATGIRVYLSILASNSEDRYFAYTIPTGGIGAFNIQFTLSSPMVLGFPPQRSSAWLPDTDGTAVSAFALYRWMNEGLDAATALTEGIRDVTGIPSTGGQAQYQVIGNWRKFSNGFYDGYPFQFGSKNDIFRHSNVVGISGTMTMNQDSYVQQVELWPQSDRSSGNGTVSSAVAVTDTTINYTPGNSGWVLGFGLALLGPFPADPSQCELIYYSGTGNGNQLTPVTRGMGGTSPQAWPIKTPVSECNIYLAGIRNPQKYTPGQSASILSLPPAWIDAVTDYMNARFKKAEQDMQGFEALYKTFVGKCQSIKGNRQTVGPRQVQIGGTGGVEIACGAGGAFGGIIFP